MFITCYIFAQEIRYEPWGVWNYDSIEKFSYIMELESGRYRAVSGGYQAWIAIIRNSKGYVAGNSNFPLLGIEGMYIKIERIEQVDDGYIFYLVGDGFKRGDGKNIKTQFKDNTRITMKMTFINENECYFQYIPRVDEEGFHLSFYAKENEIHRRYRVQD